MNHFYFEIIWHFLVFRSVSVSSGGQDDSSSEEAQTNTHKITISTKPVVPPRPRGISGIDYKRNGVPNPTTNGKTSTKITFNNEDIPCKDNDIANADCKFTKLNLNWANSKNWY